MSRQQQKRKTANTSRQMQSRQETHAPNRVADRQRAFDREQEMLRNTEQFLFAQREAPVLSDGAPAEINETAEHAEIRRDTAPQNKRERKMQRRQERLHGMVTDLQRLTWDHGDSGNAVKEIYVRLDSEEEMDSKEEIDSKEEKSMRVSGDRKREEDILERKMKLIHEKAEMKREQARRDGTLDERRKLEIAREAELERAQALDTAAFGMNETKKSGRKAQEKFFKEKEKAQYRAFLLQTQIEEAAQKTETRQESAMVLAGRMKDKLSKACKKLPKDRREDTVALIHMKIDAYLSWEDEERKAEKIRSFSETMLERMKSGVPSEDEMLSLLEPEFQMFELGDEIRSRDEVVRTYSEESAKGNYQIGEKTEQLVEEVRAIAAQCDLNRVVAAQSEKFATEAKDGYRRIVGETEALSGVHGKEIILEMFRKLLAPYAKSLNTEDPEAVAKAEKELYEGKQIYQKLFADHYKRTVLEKYGKLLTQLHARDILRLTGEHKFDYTVTHTGQAAGYITKEKWYQPDPELDKLSKYFDSMAVLLVTSYRVFNADGGSTFNPELFRGYYNMIKADGLDALEPEGGPQLTEAEQKLYQAHLKRRAKAGGWEDELYGRFK